MVRNSTEQITENHEVEHVLYFDTQCSGYPVFPPRVSAWERHFACLSLASDQHSSILTLIKYLGSYGEKYFIVSIFKTLKTMIFPINKATEVTLYVLLQCAINQ